MKKIALLIAAIAMPMVVMASPVAKHRDFMPIKAIPSQFSISGETTTLEWGCPIDNETRKAANPKTVLNELISECLEQVSRAAASKPEVAAVLQASVISPNVAIKEESSGVHTVNGTIFLETVVSLVRSAK